MPKRVVRLLESVPPFEVEHIEVVIGYCWKLGWSMPPLSASSCRQPQLLCSSRQASSAQLLGTDGPPLAFDERLLVRRTLTLTVDACCHASMLMKKGLERQ